jgi:hydroxymethylpyrimidine pyrophosphatase-like HAD family hydrolase
MISPEMAAGQPPAGGVYCRVLACDFDGTGASDGHLAPETSAALDTARVQGILTMLVTGRVLDDLQAAGLDFASFDAIVAENGAVVWLPAQSRTCVLGKPPPDALLAGLRRRGIPYHTGAVVVGTWDGHLRDVVEIIHETGVDAQVVFNRAAVMVLPSGMTKAVGVRRALAELGRSARNTIAFGDAENDHPLFDLAEVGVAARGSVPALAAAADERLAEPGAGGVARYIYRLLAAGAMAPVPARRRVVLGESLEGGAAAIPAAGADVLIAGDPRCGKSWIAGLVVERLVEAGYRICLFDPEGDHEALGARPGVLLLGKALALPAPTALPRILRDEAVSLVLTLAGLKNGEKVAYVHEALRALAAFRARTGIPHWTVVDEAHYFFREGSPCCATLEGTGSSVLVTYRPSLLATVVCKRMSAVVLTSTVVEDERYFASSLLQASGLHAPEALAAIGERQAGLLLPGGTAPRWQVFTPGARAAGHTHHGRKYADGFLPDQQAFRFLYADGAPAVAHNLAELCEGVRAVPAASLRHHMVAGDFSRWAEAVLGDASLARGLAKLERTVRAGATPVRDEIIAHVRNRYLID